MEVPGGQKNTKMRLFHNKLSIPCRLYCDFERWNSPPRVLPFVAKEMELTTRQRDFWVTQPDQTAAAVIRPPRGSIGLGERRSEPQRSEAQGK